MVRFLISSLEKEARELLDKKCVAYVFQRSFRNGFIADFALQERKVIIEMDGHPSHFTKEGKKKSRFRDYMFRRTGWKVLHFSDLQSLEKWIDDL